MNIAAIDIGSNTVLLLVAAYKAGKLNVIHEEQRTPRLGKGVDRTGKLDPGSCRSALQAVSDYKESVEKNFPGTERIIVTATSAVRDAENRGRFLQLIKEQLDLDVEVLSGEEEAELTFGGALSMLELPVGSLSMVIDIGGGSTEIIFGRDHSPIEYFSFQMGSVRFTERYFKTDPPSRQEILDCRKEIRQILQHKAVGVAKNAKSDRLQVIGVAGTLTSLAYIDLNLKEYDPCKVNGHSMKLESITGWLEQFATIPSDKLKKQYPVVMEGRAEVFLAGLLILEEFLRFYELPELVVSTGGIRHGAILKK